MAQTLDEIVSLLTQEYSKPVVANHEAEQYLNLSRKDLRGMHPDEIEEISVVLAAYAIYVQNECNKHVGNLKWIDSHLTKLLAGESHYFNMHSFEERKFAVVKTNSSAERLYNLKASILKKSEQYQFLAQRIDFYVNTLLEFKRSKRKAMQ